MKVSEHEITEEQCSSKRAAEILDFLCESVTFLRFDVMVCLCSDQSGASSG